MIPVKYIWAAGIGVGGVIIIAAVFWFWPRNQNIQPTNNNESNEQVAVECDFRGNLDGLCREFEDKAIPIAVMIDNHAEARPPVGIDKASVVFEAIAEGTITRLVAVFDSNTVPTDIGPVRSARPYFVDYATEFGAVYVHVGGSDDALALLRSRASVYDLNEFSNGQYFWRDNSRYAPHNVMTSSELVKRAMTAKSWPTEGAFGVWVFRPEAELDNRGRMTSAYIDYRSPAHNVLWEYNRDLNVYERSQGGRKHKTADGSQLMAKNIAVIYSESAPIDDYGRRETQTIGSGRAVVLQEGLVIEAEWRRDNLNQRTRFYHKQTQAEISFVPGQTWIEILPDHFPDLTIEYPDEE